MPESDLATASDRLETAAENTVEDDASDRLTDLATQLAEFEAGHSTPDHGSLARLQAALDELQADVSEDVAVTISEARDAISTYRETLDGV